MTKHTPPAHHGKDKKHHSKAKGPIHGLKHAAPPLRPINSDTNTQNPAKIRNPDISPIRGLENALKAEQVMALSRRLAEEGSLG